MKDGLKRVVTSLFVLVCSVFGFSPVHAASLVLDQGFRPPLFAEPLPPQRALLLPDGKFLLFYNTDTLANQRTGAITRYLPDGTLDTSFAVGHDYKFISAAAYTTDGQLIIAAIQSFYGGFFFGGVEQILRLNSDGSIDPTFEIGLVHQDAYAIVQAIVIQPDGKVLVAGRFNSYAGIDHRKIVRLLPDGSLDSTFTPPAFEADGYGVYAKPWVLADGKILIGGNFTSVNGVPNPGIAKLNADGSLDSSFQPSGFERYSGSTPISGIAVQNDGRILIGGRLRTGGGSFFRMALLRLNADGSVDASYEYVDFGQNGTARDLVLQPDGKPVAAIVSLGFHSFYRFEVNGPRDQTFTPPYLLDTTYNPMGDLGTATTVNLHSDGRFIIGGSFTDVNPPGTPDGSHFGVARLNSDGSVDSTLITSHKTGMEDSPSSFASLLDGSVLVSFRTRSLKHEPTMNFGVGRLLPNGSLDTNFTLSSSDPGGILSNGFVAQDCIRLLDGEFFISNRWSAGKFFPNGVQDLTFEFDIAAPEFQTAVNAPDGKVLLSANADPTATVYAPLSRIRQNGGVDTGFQLPESIQAGQVIRDELGGELIQIFIGNYVLGVQPNGKILFLYFSSDELYRFVRLNADGSIDNTFSGATMTPTSVILDYPVVFDPYTGATGQPPLGAWTAPPTLRDAHIQSDGRIVLCGEFTSYNGVSARGMVRLMPDGTVDNTFSIGAGAQWTKTEETPTFFPFVEAMEEQVDGKLLIAGTFEAFNGEVLPGIASLNPNGSVDLSFTPPVKRQRVARGSTRLARQPDGSFLLGGPYSFPNETDPTFIHLYNIGGVPVVGSPSLATAVVGQPFSYQIVASGEPTSYSASGLPSGFVIDPETGVITGTPTSANIGIYTILITATNDEGTSATFYLTLTIIPSQSGPLPSLLNISTRLKALSGDNALIGGFIISGSTPKRVIVRAIGPSLTNLGIPGALVDPVLELHGPEPFVTINNDNWRDTQEAEIQATGIPPSNNLESAIVVTLEPGAYTAIVRGKNDGTGIGLVEAYDLDSATDSQLANISTRGFVDTYENVMIGGLIAGPITAGNGRALVRAIGPSLANSGVTNALQNPRLELHDGNGLLIAANNNWKDSQRPSIEATGIAPTDDNEAAILLVLLPGNYTAVVQGENNGTGVGLVEVYNLQ